MSGRLIDVARLIERMLFARMRYYGAYVYQVTEDFGASVSMQPVVTANGVKLPDIPSVPKSHGIGGSGTKLRKGSRALVCFAGGNAGEPYVLGYLDSKVDEVKIGDSQTTTVLSGGTADAARKGDAVNAGATFITSSLLGPTAFQLVGANGVPVTITLGVNATVPVTLPGEIVEGNPKVKA